MKRVFIVCLLIFFGLPTFMIFHETPASAVDPETMNKAKKDTWVTLGFNSQDCILIKETA